MIHSHPNIVHVRMPRPVDVVRLIPVIKKVIEHIPVFNINSLPEIQRWTEEFLNHRIIADPSSLILIAEKNNDLIGFVIGSILAGIYSLEWIGILPEYQRREIGKKLMLDLENQLREKKIRKIWCTVLEENYDCRTFFSRLALKKSAI